MPLVSESFDSLYLWKDKDRFLNNQRKNEGNLRTYNKWMNSSAFRYLVQRDFSEQKIIGIASSLKKSLKMGAHSMLFKKFVFHMIVLRGWLWLSLRTAIRLIYGFNSRTYSKRFAVVPDVAACGGPGVPVERTSAVKVFGLGPPPHPGTMQKHQDFPSDHWETSPKRITLATCTTTDKRSECNFNLTEGLWVAMMVTMELVTSFIHMFLDHGLICQRLALRLLQRLAFLASTNFICLLWLQNTTKTRNVSTRVHIHFQQAH
jgi:hypothetical protein